MKFVFSPDIAIAVVWVLNINKPLQMFVGVGWGDGVAGDCVGECICTNVFLCLYLFGYL